MKQTPPPPPPPLPPPPSSPPSGHHRLFGAAAAQKEGKVHEKTISSPSLSKAGRAKILTDL